MTTDTNSTRRSFLKSSAVLAAPLAAAVIAAATADDGLKVRLARLENVAAIRELHQRWLRRVNSIKAYDARIGNDATPLFANPEGTAFDQAVRSIAADNAGEPDAINVAADGTHATGQFHCNVEIEIAIEQDCTVARMAHVQGGGFVCRTERLVLTVEYVKDCGVWAIASVDFASV